MGQGIMPNTVRGSPGISSLQVGGNPGLIVLYVNIPSLSGIISHCVGVIGCVVEFALSRCADLQCQNVLQLIDNICEERRLHLQTLHVQHSTWLTWL